MITVLKQFLIHVVKMFVYTHTHRVTFQLSHSSLPVLYPVLNKAVHLGIAKTQKCKMFCRDSWELPTISKAHSLAKESGESAYAADLFQF